MKTAPKLSLVGAGPGDPELITLKGLKAIQLADVILYDALANPALLEYASPTALKIYVGKRAGYHEKQQIEINKMIVGYAKSMGHVVRLKGGDPYVFGRGHEELEYAEQHGVESEYIPGISSAVAVPGIAGFPLTKRGFSESFMVITGTLRNGEMSKDLYLASQSKATVIILMGIGKLVEIVQLFGQQRGKDEPIALIENGSLPHQKVLVGTLKNILEKQSEEPIAPPALILIGPVVNEKIAALAKSEAVKVANQPVMSYIQSKS